MIFRFLEQLIAHLWNSFRARQKVKPERCQLQLGHLIEEGATTRKSLGLGQARRMTHLVVTGLTGSGKSYFLRNLAQQDIQSGNGFCMIDQHGDLVPAIMSYLAETGADPANVILIDPASREYAVGLNPLEAADDHSRFLQAAEITRNVADRWDFKGARTEELLRNTLFVLSANGLTLVEVSPFLTDGSYRTQLLKQVTNADVREYFTLRYDPLSDAMKATMREPVLNKLAEFIGDPHFRHILGQRESTFSFDDALATGKIVLVNVHKGRLGVHATTFASLVLGKITAAIFRRHERKLYSLFADEFQNLVAADIDFDRQLLFVTHSKTPQGEMRPIPLTARALSLLTELKRPKGRLFLYKKEPLKNLKTAWAAAIRRAGIAYCRFHDLRHTFNTRLLEAGVIADTRKALMGHSDGSDVHAIYTHVELPVLRDAIRHLEAWHSAKLSSLPTGRDSLPSPEVNNAQPEPTTARTHGLHPLALPGDQRPAPYPTDDRGR